MDHFKCVRMTEGEPVGGAYRLKTCWTSMWWKSRVYPQDEHFGPRYVLPSRKCLQEVGHLYRWSQRAGGGACNGPLVQQKQAAEHESDGTFDQRRLDSEKNLQDRRTVSSGLGFRSCLTVGAGRCDQK